jgi:pilus assembly protein CpaB
VKRRVLTVVVAVLLAAVGTLAVLAYVHQANKRAVAGLKVVNVIVAQSAIPSGTSAGQALRNGSLGTEQLPAASVPADAVQSITPDLAGLVTSAAVQPGQLLLRPMLVAAAQVTGGVAIPKGMIAVTIQLCMPEAVGGYVTAGSQVALFDTYGGNASSAQLQRTCDVGHQAMAVGSVQTRLVLPKVEVLSVGQAPASAQSSSSGSTATALDGPSGSASQQGVVLVTLAVLQADAERLIQADETGLPYLALLTSTSRTATSPPVPLFQP